MDVVEASIADLRVALDTGRVTSVGLVSAYLRRIAAYDHHGIRLNAVPVLSPTAFDDARAADERRARGEVLSLLDGIPYTAKDSYKAKGMTVSAGSPAFANLVATEDSFVVSRLRAAGAVLLGMTTMPPMANGGMQRGLDGRAESPYNGLYLTSAWTSGSSNGSGTATAASFAAFGLGEETWSSGRAPASHNALCAYTPSWGVISIRGNWPLVPTMDVCVPHTRSMADMLTVLDVIVGDDSDTRGDFWRVQPWVEIPKSTQLRPESYPALTAAGNSFLAGKKIGMPRCYLGQDERIATRVSVVTLAHEAAERLRALGAEVVQCDLPVRETYERHNTKSKLWFQGGLADNGYVPEEFFAAEIEDLCAFALEDFLRANDAPRGPKTWAEVDPSLVFPLPHGQIEDDVGDDSEMGNYVSLVRDGRARPPSEIPHIADGVRGLNRARAELLDAWMDKNEFYALAFPTMADVAPADADVNPASHDIATRDGTWVANGNLFIRHLGVPTVTVPMGVASDIGMPFGLTFAGRGWDDVELLKLGAAFESTCTARPVPPRTPSLPPIESASTASKSTVESLSLTVDTAHGTDSRTSYTIRGVLPGVQSASITINGIETSVELSDGEFSARGSVAAEELQILHSEWRKPYGTMIVATATNSNGQFGAMSIVGGC